MNNTDIKNALSAFNQTMIALEDAYMENGGEITEETESMENTISDLKELLTGEGIDSLGRWLANQEEKVKVLKAEKDSISRQINAANSTIDYIKFMVNKVLTETGTDKAKGTLYSFTPSISKTTKADKEVLTALYSAKIEEAIRSAHVPPYIGVSLTASSSIAETFGLVEGDEELFHTTETPSCRFTKPRATKKSEE